MLPSKAGNSTRHHRDCEAYYYWLKRERSACITMLTCIHDDLIRKFERYLTAKEMWHQLCLKHEGDHNYKASCLALNQYLMDQKHTIFEHLRVISTMIKEMKVVGYNLTSLWQLGSIRTPQLGTYA